MANEDIFDKEYVDERDKNSLEGLLEQLNLPPAVIKFVKEHKRLVQAGIAGLVILVVGWSLYSSYRDGKIEKSSEALFSAQESSDQQMLDKLAEVEKKFKEQLVQDGIDLAAEATNALIEGAKNKADREKDIELAALNAKLEAGTISQEQFEADKLAIEQKAFKKKKKLDLLQMF